MRIISKFKDYYDYLQGIYGVDEKLILDRTDFQHLSYTPSNNQISTFYIGEYKVQGVWINGKIHYGSDVEQFANQNRQIYYTVELQYN